MSAPGPRAMTPAPRWSPRCRAHHLYSCRSRPSGPELETNVRAPRDRRPTLATTNFVKSDGASRLRVSPLGAEVLVRRSGCPGSRATPLATPALRRSTRFARASTPPRHYVGNAGPRRSFSGIVAGSPVLPECTLDREDCEEDVGKATVPPDVVHAAFLGTGARRCPRASKETWSNMRWLGRHAPDSDEWDTSVGADVLGPLSPNATPASRGGVAHAAVRLCPPGSGEQGSSAGDALARKSHRVDLPASAPLASRLSIAIACTRRRGR